VRKINLIVATALALAVGGAGAVSVWSAAVPATTNPSSSSPSSGDSNVAPPWLDHRRDEYMRGGGGGGGLRQQWSRENDPTLARPLRAEPQWGDVDWFMKKWTPTRWQKFSELAENQRKEKLKTIVANRYRAMQELKLNDTDTYQLRIKRLQIEDRIFDLGWRVNHNGEPPTTQPAAVDDGDRAAAASRPSYASMSADQLRTELRKEVRSLIANRIEERRLHVRQLSERLNSETARLNEEQQNVDQLVETGMSNIEKQRWPGIGGELVPPMPSGASSAPPSPRSRNVNTEEAREPATIAPPEGSVQQ
jgi:hypothetical protein